MSGDVLAMETVYNFCITLTWTVIYRIYSSSKRHLMNLLRGIKLKKILVTTREAFSEI